MIKRKDLLEWESNIEVPNVKDNELLLKLPVWGSLYAMAEFLITTGGSNPVW